LNATEAIERLVAALNKIDKETVAEAFVSSLVSGRPDYRSILGTYGCFWNIDKEQLLNSPKLVGLAATDQPTVYGAGSLAFTLFFRSNSMEHGSVPNAIYELERFATTTSAPISASTESYALLGTIFDTIRKLPPQSQLTQLEKSLSGIMKGNTLHRKHMLEMFGYCDIIHPKRQPKIAGQYYNANKHLPPHPGKSEWRYPACWWTGTDGLNEDAVKFWFPSIS